MLVRVDPGSEVPIFAQIASGIRRDIVAGVLAPGTRLPSAREVAAALEVNLHTVLRAYQSLREEGLLDLRRGRGATVVSPPRDLSELSSRIEDLIDVARASGITADTLIALVSEAAHDI